MAKRSVTASIQGRLKAKQALDRRRWTHEYLAGELGLKTRHSISGFFNGKPVERHIFIEICHALDLDWEEIAELSQEIEPELTKRQQDNAPTPDAEPEPAAAETPSKNPDFVGREEAIAEPPPDNDLDKLVEKGRSHSAEVPQPQDPAPEETVSKNTDFVGREEAIAEPPPDNDLDKLVEKGRSHSARVPQPQERVAEETAPKNHDFVGREEAIAHLDNLVNEGAKVILIQGEAGIGKTRLAKEWFERQGLKNLLELDVGTTCQTIYPAEDWVKQTLRRYFDENPEQNFRAMLEQLKHKLQTPRIGVLINNLEVALFNGEFIKPNENYIELLRVLAHSTVQSVTLVTSRELLHEPGVMSLQTVKNYPKLEGLDLEAWGKYFDSHKISVDVDALSEMRQAYGGNAEVMYILSGDVQNQSQGNLKAYWQENRDDLLRHPTLEKLVQRQFNKLRDDNSQAHELLCRFGFYPNRNFPAVPKVWLFCLLWDVPEKRRQRVIDDLCARSLLKVNDEGYYLHPMIRVEAVDRLLSRESNPDKLVSIKSQIDAFLSSAEQNDSLQNFLIRLNQKSHKVPTLWKLAVIRACYFFISLECEFTSAFPIIKSIDPNCDRELERVYYLPHSSGFDMDLILAHSLGCDLDLSLYRVLVHTLSYADEPTIELPPSLPPSIASRFSALNAFYSSMARDEAKNINYALKFDIGSKLKKLLEKIKNQIEIKQPNIMNTIEHRKK